MTEKKYRKKNRDKKIYGIVKKALKTEDLRENKKK